MSIACNSNIHRIPLSVKEIDKPCSTIYLRADLILTYDQYFTTTTTTYGKIIAITILLLCHPENPMNELMKGKYHYLYNFNVNTTHNYKNE